MRVQIHKENFKYIKKHDVLKIYFTLKLMQMDNVRLTNNELNILCLFVDESKRSIVIEQAIENKFANTTDSAQNFISTLSKLNFIKKEKEGYFPLNKELFTDFKDLDMIGLDLKIVNG